MTAKIVLSIYFDVERNSDEISALLSELVGNSGEIAVTPTKAKVEKKPRKTRTWTDEEKAAFRERMVKAREAKKAKEDADIDAKAEIDLEKKTAIAEAKPVKPDKSVTKPKSSTKAKTTSKVTLPIPRTGRKVKSKPAAN